MKVESFKVLEQCGVPPRQAHAIGHAIELECAVGHEALATKVDLANLRAEMHELFHGMKSELIRWLFLVILGQTAVLTAAGYFYINLLMR